MKKGTYRARFESEEYYKKADLDTIFPYIEVSTSRSTVLSKLGNLLSNSYLGDFQRAASQRALPYSDIDEPVRLYAILRFK